MRQLPSNLSSKINQNLQTIGNNANPKMEVTVARAKSTVHDSTYWTVETIREIGGLGDVSVAPRRLKAYGRPDRIYEIHVRDGQVYTSIREYPDKLREGFKTQFSLGPGLSVGLAFNGHWERYRKFYRLITEEQPWISWVDNAGVLWTQRWDEVETKFELSTNVKKVKMIRAWKNLVILHQDHGIIVGYIKNDGKVYYRNYCIQEDGSEAWEYERELTSFTGVAANINLFITNDYRSGFIIEDNQGKIHWFVTHRNWGGMASPAENLITSINDISFSVIPISFTDGDGGVEKIDTSIEDIWFNVAESIYPQLVSISNDDEYTIRLNFNHKIEYDLTTVKSTFSVKDSMNKSFAILTTSAGVDNSELILTLENFNAASGSMFVTYDRNIIELDSVNQGSRFILEGFVTEFTPELTPPPPLEGFGEENLTIGITDIIFDVKRVYYTNMYEEESIETSITDIGFIVTKVGSSPL